MSPRPWNTTTTVSLLAAAAALGGVSCQPEAGEVHFDDLRIDGGESAEVEPRSRDPRMCASEGYRYVAFWDDRDGVDGVYVVASANGGANWPSEPTRVNHNPRLEYAARHPEIACRGAEVFVVWEDDRQSEIESPGIYYNFSQDGGGTWQTEDLSLSVNEGDWASLSPQVAVSCTVADPPVCARLVTAWYDGRDGAYDIYVNSSANYGFNWLTDGEQRADVGSDDSHSGKPRLAIDGAGGVLLAWEDRRNGTTDVYFNRSVDWGATFDAVDQRLDLDGDSAPSDSFVNGIATALGRVFVVWSDQRNGEGQDVYLARSQDGGASFSAPVRIDLGDGPGVSDSLFPQVAAQGDQVVIAWQDDRYGAYDILVAASVDGGLTWPEQPVRADSGEPGAAHSTDPQLMLDATQRVVVAWVDLRNGYEDLYFNVSVDGGATFAAEDTRVDADEAGSAISESPRAALDGEAAAFTWLDWRYGEADVLFRQFALPPVPAVP